MSIDDFVSEATSYSHEGRLDLAEACAGQLQRALSQFEHALECEPDHPATLHIVANLQHIVEE